MFGLKKEKKIEIENNLDFLKDNIDKHNGKIVYTHERSSSILNTTSNCLYLKRNTITLANNLISLEKDFKAFNSFPKLNINYMYILLEKEVLDNKELNYSDLLNNITKKIVDFVVNSTKENKVWYLDINSSINFNKFYSFNTDIYTNQLKKDLMGIFSCRTDIFSNSSQEKTIFNIEYDKEYFGENKFVKNNYFKNILVYKEKINDFHNSYNILDLINNNFIIEYFFTKEFNNKDNYFQQLIFTLSEIVGNKFHSVKYKTSDNKKYKYNNSIYYIPSNKEFECYKYNSLSKFTNIIYNN